ncbi:MAG TPA: PAS domain-containing sensor histidine kinase [Methanospirillum sp.]|nr:PAS domain-containing sensor histidine kinase [Methanospirillum sp.]
MSLSNSAFSGNSLFPPGSLIFLAEIEEKLIITGSSPDPIKSDCDPIFLENFTSLSDISTIRTVIEKASEPGSTSTGFIPCFSESGIHTGPTERDEFSGESLHPDIHTGFVQITVSRLSDKSLVLLVGMVQETPIPEICERDTNKMELMNSALLQTPDMISIHDDGFAFLSVTLSSLSAIGLSPDHLIGTGLIDYIYPEDKARVKAACEPLFAISGTELIRYRFRNGQGWYIWVESYFRTITSGDGIITLLASTRDVDHILRSYQSVRLANEKLDHLLRNTRHDILNQVTGMLGYLELLTEMVEGHVAEFIKKEQIIGERIKELSDMTRDYQGFGINPIGFIELGPVIHKVLTKPDFRDKISAEWSKASFTGVQIYADRMLDFVFVTLIQNSIQYGAADVQVRISNTIRDTDLIIIYEDNGPGIPTEQKEMIFARTYPGRKSYGLFFVTEILGITGISIRETGTPALGARFEIVVHKDGYRFESDTPS